MTTTSNVFYADYVEATGSSDQADMLLLGEVLNYNCVDITDGVRTETAPTDKQLQTRLKGYKKYTLEGAEPNMGSKTTAKYFRKAKEVYVAKWGTKIKTDLTDEEQKHADIIADFEAGKKAEAKPEPEPEVEAEAEAEPEPEPEVEIDPEEVIIEMYLMTKLTKV